MVDAVVSLFLEKLATAAQREAQIILDFDRDFKTMNDNLSLMQGFLRDLDRMQRKNDTMSAIAKELRELIYDADDIWEDCSYYGLAESNSSMRHTFNSILPTKISSRYVIGKRLKTMNENIEQITKRITAFGNKSLLSQSGDEVNNDRNWSTPIFDESLVVGLDEDLKKITSWLLQESKGLTIVGFVGMGGLGKTTIAQMVFNDRGICDRFEKRIWVSVSQRVDEKKILRSILKDLGDIGTDDEVDRMLRKINLYLTGKSYVLVLDDVWKLDGWWTRLKDNLPGGSRCYVVMTTRIEWVARMMGVMDERMHRPKLLSEADSWTLFSKVVFVMRTEMARDSELNKIGKTIVKKCGGLPLAIKAVGGVLSAMPISISYWTRIADSFTTELRQGKDGDFEHLVMTSLQLSYDELPTRLKPCFLSFSVYPEDCVILGDQLVRWWIGEGFVHLRDGKVSVESAEDHFMELVNRCLVDVVDKGHDGKVFTCKIHDLVRDLVVKIGASEAFFRSGDHRTRRMPINDGIGESTLDDSSTRLRAVVSVTNCRYVDTVEPRLVEKMCASPHLRMLDLSESISESHFDEMLSTVGSLRLLRYLNLRNAHPMLELPVSMAELTDLLVLDLSFCHNLATLPLFITTMIKLVVLDLSCCGSLMYLPKGLENLSHLQVLKGFKPSRSHGCCMGKLRFLTQLTVLEMVVTRPDQIDNDDLNALKDLSRLRFLIFNCFNLHGEEELAEKLGRLSLPRNINALNLKYYPGHAAPQWLNPHSFPLLEYLSICSVNFADFSQGFQANPTAEWRVVGLVLELLPDLVGNWQDLQRAMPHLSEVNVSWCPKLAEFPIENVEFEGGIWKRRQEDGFP